MWLQTVGLYPVYRMAAHDFLAREQFEALSEDEQLTYADHLSRALREAHTLDEKLTISGHYFFEVAEWVFSPDEVDRKFRRPLWDMFWDNAEGTAAAAAEELERMSSTWTRGLEPPGCSITLSASSSISVT
jgi:hypothetical protein